MSVTQTLDNQTVFNNMFLKFFLRGGERKGTPLYLSILKEGLYMYYTGNSEKLLQPCNGTSQPFGNHRSYSGKSLRFSCNTCHNPGDGLMAGAWNVASGMETGREKRTGPGREKRGRCGKRFRALATVTSVNISMLRGRCKVARDFPFSLRERDCRTKSSDWESGKT